MPNASLDRFLALVKRELRAEDVRVFEGPLEPPAAVNVLHARLHDGRMVSVGFAAEPEDREALSRRLEILVGTFAQSLEEASAAGRSSRPPAPRSLHQELRVLANRANAQDALVIDARSPMVWGSAMESPARDAQPVKESLRLVEIAPAPHVPRFDSDEQEEPEPEVSEAQAALARQAIDAVRALPGLDGLARGRHLRHSERGADFGYLAQSFGGIYLLVLVYGEPFDELRAERATIDLLPRIERLVMALPPLDPEPPAPTANVVRMRRPRRR